MDLKPKNTDRDTVFQTAVASGIPTTSKNEENSPKVYKPKYIIHQARS